MEINSTAFTNRGEIPQTFTYYGKDVSPPLSISDVPAGTQSLVLLMEDVDSPIGPFTHWVVWNLPPDTNEIGEGAGLPEGAQVGMNGFGFPRYGGPCPPSGIHRYRFQLYALDTLLEATTPDRKDQIMDEMEGRILAETSLTGFSRAKE